MLELGDAELQLVVGLARDEPELVEERLQARPGALRQPGCVATPADHRVLDRLTHLVAPEVAAVGQIARELIGPVGAQRDRADTCQRQALDQLANGGLVVAGGVVGHQRARPCGRELRRWRRRSRLACEREVAPSPGGAGAAPAAAGSGSGSSPSTGTP